MKLFKSGFKRPAITLIESLCYFDIDCQVSVINIASHINIWLDRNIIFTVLSIKKENDSPRNPRFVARLLLADGQIVYTHSYRIEELKNLIKLVTS